MVKNQLADAGEVGSIPGSGRSPGGRHDNPLQDSCLEHPMDRGAWRGYSPWGRKESDTTQVTKYLDAVRDIKMKEAQLPPRGPPEMSLEGNGNPLQYSCLENPMDRGAGGLQSMGSLRVGHD